ncbi:hypothetical protein [Paraburkholderia tropica]|uniref:hypothetical protein n=1 Tax=Paraburkholderia tropica TaxID=92647 RepID=UPI002AB2CDCE|nr:hypothetical protein [Paraburkholderia tropica]
MKYLATLPKKTRFYAALAWLPLTYLLMNGMAVALPWASAHGGIPSLLLTGALCIVTMAYMQRIAAAIVRIFYREEQARIG